ncbi:MAG: hypothetical protein ACR2I2_08650 [Bryobacteraceae bacterium]
MSAGKGLAGAFILLCGVRCCYGHIGSPDVYYEGGAGPYKLLVAIRPPTVIPGVARVEIQALSAGIQSIRILPMPLAGDGAKFPPTPDFARRSKEDPRFYTGTLWMMGFGSWQVRVEVDGANGPGRLAIPVPAIASNTAGMRKQLGAGLFAAMLFLVFGLVSIVGAGVREARLQPGVAPPPVLRKRSYIAMAIAGLTVGLILYNGDRWWTSEADSYRNKVYKPLQMTAALERGNRLTLQLKDPGWFTFRRLDDLVPDHDHLMHLFAIRMPGMDRMWHLHPDEGDAGIFTLDLPSMPAGRYKLFADIVHENGLAETATTEADLPAVTRRPLSGDDAAGAAPPVSEADTSRTISMLPNGYRLVWLRGNAPMVAKRMELFQFQLEDPNGKPARDTEPYMGMAGHAEFVKDNGKVFAHVHPAGSVSMAALAMTQAMTQGARADMASMPEMHGMRIPALVSFPYGFPEPGPYRVFVQMKRGGEVVTGVFDADVK